MQFLSGRRTFTPDTSPLDVPPPDVSPALLHTQAFPFLCMMSACVAFLLESDVVDGMQLGLTHHGLTRSYYGPLPSYITALAYFCCRCCRFHGLRFVPADMRWSMVGTGVLACKGLARSCSVLGLLMSLLKKVLSAIVPRGITPHSTVSRRVFGR